MAINPNLNTIFSMRKERARQYAQGSPASNAYPVQGTKSRNYGASGRLYRTFTPSSMGSVQAEAPQQPVDVNPVRGPFAGPPGMYTQSEQAPPTSQPVSPRPVHGPFAGPLRQPISPRQVHGPLAGPPGMYTQSEQAPPTSYPIKPRQVHGPLAGPQGMGVAQEMLTDEMYPYEGLKNPVYGPTNPQAGMATVSERLPGKEFPPRSIGLIAPGGDDPFGYHAAAESQPAPQPQSGPILTPEEDAAVRRRAAALMAPIIESLGGNKPRYEAKFADLDRQAMGSRAGSRITDSVIDQVNQTDAMGFARDQSGLRYSSGIDGGMSRQRIPMTQEQQQLAQKLQAEIEDRAQLRQQGLDPGFPQATPGFGAIGPVGQGRQVTQEQVAQNISAREQELAQRKANARANAMQDAAARRSRLGGGGEMGFIDRLAATDPGAAARYQLGMAALQADARRADAALRESGLDRDMRKEVAQQEFDLKKEALSVDRIDRERQYQQQLEQGRISQRQHEQLMAQSERQHEVEMQKLTNEQENRKTETDMAKGQLEDQKIAREREAGDLNRARLSELSGADLLTQGVDAVGSAVARSNLPTLKPGESYSPEQLSTLRRNLDSAGITPEILTRIEAQHKIDTEGAGMFGGGIGLFGTDSTPESRAARSGIISAAHMAFSPDVPYKKPAEPSTWFKGVRTGANVLPSSWIPAYLRETFLPGANYLP